jgi:hypothetical protein
MQETYFERFGCGKYILEAVVTRTCEGINIYVGGGEKPHIGSIVVSQPRYSLSGDGTISCTTSVFNLVGHKDDIIAIPLAEKLCIKTNQVIAVSAGVHVDNATTEDIKNLKKVGEELIEKILMKFD